MSRPTTTAKKQHLSIFDEARRQDEDTVFKQLAKFVSTTLKCKYIPLSASKKKATANPDAFDDYDNDNSRNLWSPDADELEQTVLASPWKLDERFVIDFLKRVSVVDKRCSKLGSEFKCLDKLVELSITGNDLTEIDGNALPPSLEILHAHANQISNLKELSSTCPPSLCHLGLGFNKITELVPDELAPTRWLNLLSLDLSFNDLDDLEAFAKVIAAIPTLAILAAVGNPFALLPTYRSFLVHRISQLSHLDDIEIQPKDRQDQDSVPKVDLKPRLTICIQQIKHLKNPKFDSKEFENDDSVNDTNKSKKSRAKSAKKKPNSANKRGSSAKGKTPEIEFPLQEYTYQVVMEFPNNQEIDVNAEIGSVIPEVVRKIEGQSSPGQNFGGDSIKVTQALSWSSTMAFDKTFDIEINNLKNFKSACMNGCRFDIYETMVETIEIEARPDSAKKKKNAPPDTKQLPAVVNFVGTVLATTENLLENADIISIDQSITDSSGNTLPGEVVKVSLGGDDSSQQILNLTPTLQASISLPRL